MSRPQTNEAEAVKTTIVGGRPPGSGRNNVAVPRGIEVLIKKAAVDAEFRELLLAQRGRAAASIELELDPAESAMLSAIPREQLARIVDQTEVATELRPAFAGCIGAVMLAALGASLVASAAAKPAGVQSGAPQGAASAAEASVSTNAVAPPQEGFMVVGNVAQWPTNPAPANPPATNWPPGLAPQSVTVLGARINPPSNPTNLPMTVLSEPGVTVLGARITPPPNPPATNRPLPVPVVGATISPPTNPPPTNPPPNFPTNAVIRGLQPTEPPVIVAGLMMRVPPPNPSETNPPAKSPEPEQK